VKAGFGTLLPLHRTPAKTGVRGLDDRRLQNLSKTGRICASVEEPNRPGTGAAEGARYAVNVGGAEAADRRG
jgi:hypothetical protein